MWQVNVWSLLNLFELSHLYRLNLVLIAKLPEWQSLIQISPMFHCMCVEIPCSWQGSIIQVLTFVFFSFSVRISTQDSSDEYSNNDDHKHNDSKYD